MQLIHKVDLNVLSDDKIRLTHNDINVHIFEITIPDFIDNPENLNITMNIVDLWGNYVRINNEGLESRKVRFRLTEFFKSVGTRTCEVVFSKDNKIYHAQKFKYHVDKNLDDDCSIVETEQYPILLELLDRVKKQLEETGTLNSEVEKLIDSIEDKLEKGEFDGRSVDFKVDGMRVGFKYSDEEEYEWVDLETKIPAPVMKEIEKIQFKADKSYVDGQVIQLREDLDSKVNQDEYDETIQLLKEDVALKVYKSELKTKLSEFKNDSKFITQDDVVDYDDSKLVSEINTLKDTKANKSEVPSKLSQLENDSKYITLQEVSKFDDSDLKNSINQLEQNKANKVHTHVSSEIKHNSTTLDKELSTINNSLKDKANKVDIPAKLSQLENDKGYITEADVDLTEVNKNIKELQDNKANKIHAHSSNDISVDDNTLTETLKTINNTLDNKANNSELKTKLSEFENDAKFTTLNEVDKSDTIKNINVELAKKVDKSEKGKADGVVPLNKNSKIALEYLPDLSKQQTHIVETVEDMQKLENLLAGDKAFVVSSGDSYIWSGTEWKVLSKAEWENINLDWANIINNPLTSDDLVNISQIPTKADKNNIPSKISQLEDDKNITKDIQTLKDTKVDKVEGKTLTDNNYSSSDKLEVAKIKDKANVIHKHNIEDINTLTEKLAGINKAIASKAETSYVDKQIKEVKDLIDNIDIPEVDLSEINKSIADLEKNKAEFDSVIGDLETLTTEEKGELVGSINEINKYVADTNKELSKKVDKVTGKQLSTNDYTTVEKNKLEKLENYNDTSIKADIAKKADTLTVNTNLSKKVDKVVGKGLSTNDYDNVEKNKLAGIQAGANKYTHPGSGTNPHGTTKSDVGLSNVDNVKQASKEELDQLATDFSAHQAGDATDAHRISNISGLQQAIDGAGSDNVTDNSITFGGRFKIAYNDIEDSLDIEVI